MDGAFSAPDSRQLPTARLAVLEDISIELITWRFVRFPCVPGVAGPRVDWLL